jgi:pimeloyl-ACP methyl ester carboxylesterase
LGVNASTYTALIEEVVSRGYIVAAIEPTFEVPAVAFPDGRVLGLSEDATGRHTVSPPGDTKEKLLQRLHDFDAGHLDQWAADIRLTIDKVTEINAADKNVEPFSGRVDIANIAAWGHSFGGQATARACQTEPRLKACLNADGVSPDGPIFSYPDTALPSQPFLWMEVHHDPPTDELLTVFHTTREAWDKDHQAQQAANQKQLKAAPGGSFHVTINLPGVEHYSFSDKPLIQAKTSRDADQATHALEAIEQYTLAFFDRYLKQQSNGMLDQAATPTAGVTVESFAAAK